MTARAMTRSLRSVSDAYSSAHPFCAAVARMVVAKRIGCILGVPRLARVAPGATFLLSPFVYDLRPCKCVVPLEHVNRYYSNRRRGEALRYLEAA